jgi:hypothetical protein
VPSDRELNLERDLPVTPEDVVALRQLRTEVPSWLLLNWRELQALVPTEGLRERPPANDRWLPFSLE